MHIYFVLKDIRVLIEYLQLLGQIGSGTAHIDRARECTYKILLLGCSKHHRSMTRRGWSAVPDRTYLPGLGVAVPLGIPLYQEDEVREHAHCARMITSSWVAGGPSRAKPLGKKSIGKAIFTECFCRTLGNSAKFEMKKKTQKNRFIYLFISWEALQIAAFSCKIRVLHGQDNSNPRHLPHTEPPLPIALRCHLCLYYISVSIYYTKSSVKNCKSWWVKSLLVETFSLNSFRASKCVLNKLLGAKKT